MKRRNLLHTFIAANAIMAAVPATARVVDYSVSDELIRQEGFELKIAPISEAVQPGDRNISLNIAPGIDHITMALGMYCSAYKVENPVTQLLQRLAADRSIAASASNTTTTTAYIAVTSARSYRRCVELGEMNVRCIVRVSINGTVADKDGATGIPISADVERDSSVSGICGSLARGIRVVSREAGIALFKDAEAKLAARGQQEQLTQ